MRKSMLAAAAAVSMLSVSSGALAQSAAPLSLAGQYRAGADLREANDLRGGFILPTLAMLAIVGVIFLLTRDDNPSSP